MALPLYKEPLFRPPAEADSLIFQLAYGCPHNRCRFCHMYKSVRYAVRPLDEVLYEIASCATVFPHAKRFFLADGDVFKLPFTYLQAILKEIGKSFPRAARINSYANSSSILAKSNDELSALSALKLNTLYLGLESGSEKVLKLVNKGETAEDAIAAARKTEAAKLKLSVMVLLGVGGKIHSREHAQATASVLNAMQMRQLSILRYIEVVKGKLFDSYEMVSEYEAMEELYEIVRYLDLTGTVFRANHSSNPVGFEARLPHDKERLVEEIKAALANGNLDREGPGRVPLFL